MKFDSAPYLNMYRTRRIQLVVVAIFGLFFVLTLKLLHKDDDGTCSHRELYKVPKVLSRVQLKRQLDVNVWSLVEKNEKRLTWVEDVCKRHQNMLSTPTLGEVWTSTRHSLAFCVVPKVGCTYWKRIMRYLENDVPYDVTYPSDIDRYSVHFLKLNTIGQFFVDKPGHLDKIQPGIKFMFTRDPFARLWSAYLDKFYLPDFWHIAKYYAYEKKPNCGNDVTFEEFILYNYDHRNDVENHLNEHFSTVAYNCDPCRVKFDVIGKAESFKSDSDLVLANVGLLGDIPENPNLDRAADEISNLVDYNIDILKISNSDSSRDTPRECFDLFDISRRLWKVFQFNGYIGDEIQFPKEPLRQLSTPEQFKDFLKRTIFNLRQSAEKGTLSTWKIQRDTAMRNAYISLNEDSLRKFQDMYRIDFELFQYEMHPTWLNI